MSVIFKNVLPEKWNYLKINLKHYIDLFHFCFDSINIHEKPGTPIEAYNIYRTKKTEYISTTIFISVKQHYIF